MIQLIRIAALLSLVLPLSARAQQEGPVPTQALVTVSGKSAPANASAVSVAVNDRKEPLTGWAAVTPSNAQVAMLLDSGLRMSIGRELSNLKSFIQSLPPNTEVMVGYMMNGRVMSDQSFTTDHSAIAESIRMPEGLPGASASPYFCLSDFVKKWPKSVAPNDNLQVSTPRKARFVLMITNGVDPYNGSTSVMNQDSPYVQAAITDAQRAGVAVYSIYFNDAGMRGQSVNFSGQSYLTQLTEATGGANLWQGTSSPVSTAPYLDQFKHAVSETFVATFNAPAQHNGGLVRVKFSAPNAKLRGPEQVRPGNQE